MENNIVWNDINTLLSDNRIIYLKMNMIWCDPDDLVNPDSDLNDPEYQVVPGHPEIIKGYYEVHPEFPGWMGIDGDGTGPVFYCDDEGGDCPTPLAWAEVC